VVVAVEGAGDARDLVNPAGERQRVRALSGALFVRRKIATPGANPGRSMIGFNR
jgi:hypothetical protein